MSTSISDRIEMKPTVLLGKPVIRGTRISVEHIVSLYGLGWSEGEILRNYPALSREDLVACLSYAATVLSGEAVFPAHS